MNINPMLMCDFYKTTHAQQFPEGTTKLVSYFTPRMSRLDGVDSVVVFGIQAFCKNYLIDYFNENFFNQPADKVKAEYQHVLDNTLGFAANNVSLGVGSFSMQCIEQDGVLKPFTRDTFGMAVKATYGVINGKEIPIFKNPKTDTDHFKKSLKGLCNVSFDTKTLQFIYKDGLNQEQWNAIESYNWLDTVYRDSQMIEEQSLSEIRNTLNTFKSIIKGKETAF